MKTLEDLMHQAQEAQHISDWAAALVCYRQALAQYKPTTTIWFGLGQTLLGLRRWQEAFAAFEAVLQQESTHVDAELGAANAALRLGRLDRAAQGYSQQLDRIEAHLGLAEVGLARGDYALVELEAQQVLRMKDRVRAQASPAEGSNTEIPTTGPDPVLQRAQLLLVQSRLLLGDLTGAMKMLRGIKLPTSLLDTDPDNWLVYLWRLRAGIDSDQLVSQTEASFWEKLAEIPLDTRWERFPSELIFMPPEATAPPEDWMSWHRMRTCWLQQMVQASGAYPPQCWPDRTAGDRPRVAVYADPRIPVVQYLMTRWVEAMAQEDVEFSFLVPEGAAELVRYSVPVSVLPINERWTTAQLARLIAERDFDLLLDWVGASDARFAAVLGLQVARVWLSQPWTNALTAVQNPCPDRGGAEIIAVAAAVPFPQRFFQPKPGSGGFAVETSEGVHWIDRLRVGLGVTWLNFGGGTQNFLLQLTQSLPQVDWVLVAESPAEVEWLQTQLAKLGLTTGRCTVTTLRDFPSAAWAQLDAWLDLLPGDITRPCLAWAHQVPVLHLICPTDNSADFPKGDLDRIKGWLTKQGRADWVWSSPSAWLEGVLAFLGNPAAVKRARQQLVFPEHSGGSSEEDGREKSNPEALEKIETQAWRVYARELGLVLRETVTKQSGCQATYEHLSARLRDGVLAQQSERWAEAEAVYRELLSLQPRAPMVGYLLAEVLTRQEKHEEALPILEWVIQIAPAYTNAWLALADCLTELDRIQEIPGYLQRAVAMEPNKAVLWRALARAHMHHGDQAHLEKAEYVLHKALTLDAGQADTFFLQGLLAQRRGEALTAFQAYQKTLAFDQRHREAQFNLGILAWQAGNIGLALAAFDAVLQQNPGLVAVYPYRGEALYAAQRYTDWLANGDQYRQYAPNSLRQMVYALETAQFLGDFDQIDRLLHGLRENKWEADSSLELLEALDTLLYLLHFFDLEEDVFARLYRTFDRTAQIVYGEPLHLASRAPLDQPARRLRIGYLSADWRDHVMGKMLREIVCRHDRSRVEVYAYATDPREDAITEEMKGYTDRWISLAGWDERLAAERIAVDNLDVLIDCSGHTQGGKPGILALKPAPVVGSHVAAAGAVGLSTIDFKLTDRYADIPAAQETILEQLMVLDGCCYPFRAIPFPANGETVYPYTREQLGLNNRVVIGAFVTHLKLSRRCLMLWKRVLDALPEAVLAFSPSHDGLHAAYLNLLKSAGISSERAVFLPRGTGEAASQMRYRYMDFVLDPVPYGGVNGTLEALNAKVPVITLVGKRHSERSGYSILMNLGVTETIAQQANDYVATAVRLARDPGFKAQVVATIAAGLKDSALVDMDAYVKRWEEALWASCRS